MPQGNLPHALEYIKRGWRIFPLFYVLKNGTCSCRKAGCKRTGKHPVIRNGVLSASSNEAEIRRWWTESPWANIGLACGHDGLVVIDVDEGMDKKTGQPKIGPASLQTLTEANAMLPSTLVAKTGGGGRHFYFLSTAEIKNSQDVIGKNIDVRGSGGYVILPPSNHESGTKYSWQTAIETPITDLPGWLESLCVSRQSPNLFDNVDEEQNERIKKSLKENKFSEQQLVRLLDFIPADCDREQWWQIGAALKKELGDDKGWRIWNDWSRKAPDKYDEKTAVVQWNSFADKGLTGGTVYHFAQQNGFRGFDTETADCTEFKENWIYAISIKRFIETARLMEWDKEQFDARFAPLFQRGKASDHVLKNEQFRRVDGVTYWPEQPMYLSEFGQSKMNYWRKSDTTPAVGDVSKFLSHVEYLFPEKEANILLDYLAYQVQCPGQKVHWAVLLEGDQGNGKSYFATVMRIVLGPHNVKMVHNDQLHETFTQWQRNTQLIVVEEMMAKQRLELMNKLKPMITEDWCTIREMYRPPYEQPNRFNFLFFSNHKDSLIIDNTDRRYCILKSSAPPHPDGNNYYGPLFQWTRNNGPALAHYLANRPLGDFQPKAHAPMTEGKADLIQRSMMPLDQFIHDAVETREYPCQWDLLSPNILIKPLSDHNLRVDPKAVVNAFTRLGYLDLGRMREGEERIRMWAVREFEMYSLMSSTQLRQVWLAQVNGTPREPGPEALEILHNGRPANGLKNLEAM